MFIRKGLQIRGKLGVTGGGFSPAGCAGWAAQVRRGEFAYEEVYPLKSEPSATSADFCSFRGTSCGSSARTMERCAPFLTTVYFGDAMAGTHCDGSRQVERSILPLSSRGRLRGSDRGIDGNNCGTLTPPSSETRRRRLVPRAGDARRAVLASDSRRRTHVGSRA